MSIVDLIGRLRERDVRLAMDGARLIFDGPTEVINEELLSELRRHKQQILEQLVEGSISEVVSSGPVTPAQRRFAQRHAELSNQAVLNVAFRLNISGRLDCTALTNALSGLIDRHHALRTQFREYGEHFVQEVLPTRAVELPIVDLGTKALTGPESEEAVSLWCQRQACLPFRLENDPLIRFALAAVADDQWVLIIVQHHIITDAMSISNMLSDLALLYRAEVERQGTALPPPPAQLLDFARWQQTRLTGNGGVQLLAYWRDELAGATFSLPLPGDRPRPDVLSGNGTLQRFVVRRELSEKLKGWTRTRGVTLYSILVSAFGNLLCQLVNQEEVVIIGAFPNRARLEFEPVVGPLTNTLPLRLRRRPHESIGETIERTALLLSANTDHQDLPFLLMLERLKIRERPDAVRFPQAWLTMDPHPDRRLDMAGLQVQVQDITMPGARSDIGILAVQEAKDLHLWVESSTDFLEPETVRAWMEQYIHLLQKVVDDPSCLVRKW